jgi:glycosyltransferase involved in cell wall biosynthesis
MKLSIIVPVLNSHEIVRRQVLHFEKCGVPADVEILYMDDGSDPPIEVQTSLSNFHVIPTHDTRPWTWAVARNTGAKLAQGDYFFMTDLDYIIPRQAIDDALAFDRDYMGCKRAFGILDENGVFSDDYEVLKKYGLSNQRLADRGTRLPPHPNNFIIRKDLFFGMGGYREDLIGKAYPAGEDNLWKKERHRWVAAGKLVENDYRPIIYMFPNGQYCGDVDYNPFELFHTLTRKTSGNYWYKHPRYPRKVS